jgi:hypothetical protein
MPTAKCEHCNQTTGYRAVKNVLLEERPCPLCQKRGGLRMIYVRRNKPEPNPHAIPHPNQDGHPHVVRTATGWSVQFHAGPLKRRSPHQWSTREEAIDAIRKGYYR